jgi:phosphoribosylformylglycinamidine synthase
MVRPRALVVCGDGINCDAETASALELAGFDSVRSHVTDLLESPAELAEAKLLVIPGGFSFGDEIASCKVLALKIKEKVSDLLHQFVDNGNLVIGICNGFQMLVQMGLLPSSERGAPPVVSLTKNSGGKFMNRWVELVVDHNAPCRFFDLFDTIQLPVRHGEGRLALGAAESEQTIEAVKRNAALRYKEDVNGSFDRIAALSNATGNVLGLMPHPEAFVRWTQHPNWYRERQNNKGEKPEKQDKTAKNSPPPPDIPHGLAILQNAAKMLTVD